MRHPWVGSKQQLCSVAGPRLRGGVPSGDSAVCVHLGLALLWQGPRSPGVPTLYRRIHTHAGFVASVGAEVVGQKGDAWEECRERTWEPGAGVGLAGGRRGFGVCFISSDRAGRSTCLDRGRLLSGLKSALVLFTSWSSVLVFLDAALSSPSVCTPVSLGFFLEFLTVSCPESPIMSVLADAHSDHSLPQTCRVPAPLPAVWGISLGPVWEPGLWQQ